MARREPKKNDRQIISEEALFEMVKDCGYGLLLAHNLVPFIVRNDSPDTIACDESQLVAPNGLISIGIEGVTRPVYNPTHFSLNGFVAGFPSTDYETAQKSRLNNARITSPEDVERALGTLVERNGINIASLTAIGWAPSTVQAYAIRFPASFGSTRIRGTQDDLIFTPSKDILRLDVDVRSGFTLSSFSREELGDWVHIRSNTVRSGEAMMAMIGAIPSKKLMEILTFKPDKPTAAQLFQEARDQVLRAAELLMGELPPHQIQRLDAHLAGKIENAEELLYTLGRTRMQRTVHPTTTNEYPLRMGSGKYRRGRSVGDEDPGLDDLIRVIEDYRSGQDR